MDSNRQPIKRKRGRPRKNIEKPELKQEIHKKENSIVLFLALSDEESDESEYSNNNNNSYNNNQNIKDDNSSDNNFVVNSNPKKKGIFMPHLSDIDTSNFNSNSNSKSKSKSKLIGKGNLLVSDKDTDTDMNTDSDMNTDTDTDMDIHTNLDTKNDNSDKNKISIVSLMDEIKKRDTIIAKLRNNTSNTNTFNTTSSYNPIKRANIRYHHTHLADADNGKMFEPALTNEECWWCDYVFDNLPAYLVNNYKNGVYYVFGNYCSFNCSFKYNLKMLKDFKCNTRHALTNNLRMKVTGESGPIRLAGERELLKTKQCTISEFRSGFSVIKPEMKINIPPMIPLIHVIEEGKKY